MNSISSISSSLILVPTKTSNTSIAPTYHAPISTPKHHPLTTTPTVHSISRRGASLLLSTLSLVQILGPTNARAVEDPCELSMGPSGLAFCDRVVGEGPEAVKGQLIKAHYVGRLENGTVFDSSYSHGQPLTFHIGIGEVIKGWDQGILGGDGIPPMLAGGKRTLKLPPELGYGVRGAGCKGGSCIIPPNSTLIFDVEFLGKA